MTSHFLHSIGISEDTDANFELLNTVDVIGFDQPDEPFNGVVRWTVYADLSGATWCYFVTHDGAGHEIYSVNIDYKYTAPAVVTRITESVETWASRSEWEAGQTPMEGPGGQPVYLGPGFIANPWLSALAEGSATTNDANPIAILNGTCETVDLLTNQLTRTQVCTQGRLHHRGRSLPRRKRGSLAGAVECIIKHKACLI